MATTDLKLDAPGTLPKPGPVGRLVRLVFGILCAWYIFALVAVVGDFHDDGGHIRSLIWNGLPAGLFLISYVINIGFSRAWKKWPALVSAAVFLLAAGIGYVSGATAESAVLAWLIWSWEVYLFAHLGLAFLLAALIGTPGCEMRAFHDLFSRLTGVATAEHYCPVGPLHPVDRWEAERKR